MMRSSPISRGSSSAPGWNVVATYLDQNLTDAGTSTLHVVGRTYSHPHKYFYRTYSSGTWSAWESVDAKIEGDHVALAFWKGRLNLFWVTFINQAQPPAAPSPGGTPVIQLHFGDLINTLSSLAAQALAQPQLHWCEYYQGKWTTPISSDPNRYAPIPVSSSFVPSEAHVRVSKDGDESVGEGALKVLLDFPLSSADPNYDVAFFEWDTLLGFAGVGIAAGPMPMPIYSFRITSKNCDLVLNDDFYSFAPENPYNTTSVDASLYPGSGSLTATFQASFDSSGNGSETTEQILQEVNSFAVLPCANPVVPSPFLDPTEPQYLEAGALVSPFFYKDLADVSTSDEMAFYVQPSLTETTITQWNWWAVGPGPANQLDSALEGADSLTVVPQVPTAGPSPAVVPDLTGSLYPMRSQADWLTEPATTVAYNGTSIGKSGGTSASTNPAAATVQASG